MALTKPPIDTMVGGVDISSPSAGDTLKYDGTNWAKEDAKTYAATTGTSYTVLATDDVVIADPSGGDFTVTLEADPANGRKVTIKSIATTASNAVIIDPNSKTLEGGNISTIVLESVNRPSVTLVYYTTASFIGWWIV